MVVASTRDRRAERREATRAEILEAAWDLARTEGLAGLSLRDVARKIGIRPPSLYWYFDSKHAVYDAMFAQGYRQLLARLAEREWPTEPRALLRLVARVFVEFFVEDVQRYQLMNQRTIPNFEPSAETYAIALQVFEEMRTRLAVVGLSDPAALDMWIALVSGIAAQQTANEPGGDRWLRLIDEMVDIYADHLISRKARPTTGGAALKEVARNARH
jgi:AcrR family transcriptional regulator